MGRELKRVALDFKWPLNKVWVGFLNPHYAYSYKCETCDGSGYSPEVKHMHDEWYGYAPFRPEDRGSKPFLPTDVAVRQCAERNLRDRHASERTIQNEAERLAAHFNRRWMHHLNADDVAALVEANRLYDFTHTYAAGEGWKPKDPPYIPTPEEVNAWSLSGIGHDGVNQRVVIKAECKRLNVSPECPDCHGEGELWTSQEKKDAAEAWEREEPPAGDGYQMWETVSEGSPVSPVFATPEELASYMVSHDDSVTRGTTYAQWMEFINGPGWAPSFIGDSTGLHAGVQGVN